MEDITASNTSVNAWVNSSEAIMISTESVKESVKCEI